MENIRHAPQDNQVRMVTGTGCSVGRYSSTFRRWLCPEKQHSCVPRSAPISLHPHPSRDTLPAGACSEAGSGSVASTAVGSRRADELHGQAKM